MKCKKETQELLLRHCGGSSSSAILYEKLSAIPVSAWEDELPILEVCIQESHRLAFGIINLPKNVGEDIEVGRKVVKRGDFLAYLTSEIQLNLGYTLSRTSITGADGCGPILFRTPPFHLGWGAGRHPCPGMRVAKLEMTNYGHVLDDMNTNSQVRMGSFPILPLFRSMCCISGNTFRCGANFYLFPPSV